VVKKSLSYYRKFRLERNILRELVDRPPILNFSEGRRTYRFARLLYYRIIPHLLFRLFEPNDTYLCRELESYYYFWLISWKLVKGLNTKVDRLPCYARYTGDDVDTIVPAKQQLLLLA